MLTACKVPAIHDTFSQVIKHYISSLFIILLISVITENILLFW